jgi:hypothetical protein
VSQPTTRTTTGSPAQPIAGPPDRAPFVTTQWSVVLAAGGCDEISYRDMGRRLGLSEGAIKVAVHRLRRRYRELLRDEVARTIDGTEAVEEELRHLLATLKILLPEKGADPRFAERFQREAQALARLNHPNIVTVHDFGEADGMFFLPARQPTEM